MTHIPEGEILAKARANSESHYAALRERSERKQPERELADYCLNLVCKRRWEECHCERICKGVAEAQLAHDKATMVKIDWLFERCPHSTDPLFLATRHECDECMDKLLKR